MSGFWSTARDAAAAEYGRRNYRTFAVLAMLRRFAPVLSALVIAGAVVAGGGWAAAERDAWVPRIPQVVVVLSIVAGASLLLAFTVWVWRNRWRWQRW